MADPLPTEASVETLLLQPSRGWQMIDLRELWRYRELAYFLSWRDVKVRYKQTALGALWAVLQPFMSMVVFTLFFGRFMGMNQRTGGVPYPVFVYAGMLPWLLFSQAVTRSTESVLGSASLITKVYFPRLLIPLAATGACLVDFAVSFLVLVGIMLWYGVVPGAGILVMPLLMVLAVTAALGIGIFISAVIVNYRDFRHVVPFAVQILMFATPVIYPSTVVPEKWRWALALNPIAGIIEGFRASVLGGVFDWPSILLSGVVSVAALVFSVAYFRRVERQFADII